MSEADRRQEEEQAKSVADRAQRSASDPAVSAWVSANAGTGKTKVLVDRVLRLLLAGAPPERILCLTYTKAAAAEMANRIDRTLAEWATAPDDALDAALTAVTGDRAPGTAAAARRARARRLFARVLEAPGGLRIATLHAFCQMVLKRFPVESGVPPHFAVIDERDATAAMAEAQRAAIGAAQADPEGKLAAALALVADLAGETGFADLMGQLLREPRRLAAALADGIDAFAAHVCRTLDLAPGDTETSILAAACAAAAPRDADLKRAGAALARGGKTDQANSAPVLAWLAASPAERAAGFEDYCVAYFTQKGERRARLSTREAQKAWPDVDGVLAAEAERLAAVRTRIGAARSAAATEALFRLGAEVLRHYEAYKRSHALLDFADLIARTRDLLAGADEGGPAPEAAGAAAWVLWKLDGGIDHIMVDEAQDTSPEQWDLVRRLTAEFFAGRGRENTGPPRTLFVVGDFKQSIFSFQGAAPEEFRRMHVELKRRAAAARLDWRDEPLIVSFRSVRAVLDAVDTVFGHEAARAGVAGEGESIRHLTARHPLGGIVEVWPTVKPPEDAEDAPWQSAPPQAAAPSASERLAAAIADRIAEWRDRVELLESRGRPVRPGDVMILVRRRGRFMDDMVSALKRRGLPIAGVDRMRLGEQLAVQDLIALGRFALLPEDDLTLATVLKGPFFGFDDDAHLFPLAHDRGTLTLWQRLAAAADRAPFDAAHARLRAVLARADYAPPFEFFARLLDAEGGRRDLLRRLGPDAEDPTDEFLELALDYQRRHPPSLEGFLHWVQRGETEVKRDLDQSGRDDVRVMTVHGAKGLQAPIVFLADTCSTPMDDARILWHARDAEPPLFAPSRAEETAPAQLRRQEMVQRQMEEYRRLFYVALTRAADRLYVCGFETKQGIAKNSWYALVTEAFAAEPRSDFDFAPDWRGPGWRFERHGAPDTPEAAPAAYPSLPGGALPPWATAAAPAELPAARALAPSQPTEVEPPVRSPFMPDDALRFRRGTLIHRLLQTLPDLPSDQHGAAARRYLALPMHGLDAALAEAIAAETLRVLADPAGAPLFAAGSLAEVPVAGTVAGAAVSGQVDRLVVRAHDVLIVDYKTNRAPPATPAEVPPLYLKQMAAYRALLSAIYPAKTIRCFLLWTDAPRLMEIAPAMFDSHGARA